MKRTLAILLAMAMLVGLCACGGISSEAPAASSSETISGKSSEVGSVDVDKADDAENADELRDVDSAEAPTEVVSEDTYATMYPVEEDGVTLTLMLNLGGFVFQFIDSGDLNATLAAQVQEAETGIHIEYQSIDQDAYSEKFLLMVASGDYTDLCSQANQLYPGGIDGLIDDGVMLDLNEYKEYMPDFVAFGQENPEFIKSMTSDSGHLVSVYNYVPDTDYCMLYRADLLEQVGLDIPKTYDQLHEVLLAFRDKTDVAVPLGLSSSGFVGGMQGGAALTGGFDVGAPTEEDLGWTVDDDGKVVCSAVSDNMKEFLDMWSTWYSEGLLTKDYINQVSNRSDEITSGQVGVAYNMMTCVSDTEREMYGIQMVTGPDIVKNEGDIIHTGINEHPNSQGSGSIAVSTMCEYPEVACEWLNWFFTEKGRESYNFGIKGETYDIDADGVPYYTDAIMNNELGVGVGLATSMIIGWAAMPFPRYHERTTALYTNDEEKGMYDMWVENRDNTHVYFGDLTQTESEQFSSVSSDILTYVSTSISEFIMGDRPMDEWNTYVDQCYSMGIQTLIDLKQAAYDRYCAR